jgi:hypothetical protein
MIVDLVDLVDVSHVITLLHESASTLSYVSIYLLISFSFNCFARIAMPTKQKELIFQFSSIIISSQRFLLIVSLGDKMT